MSCFGQFLRMFPSFSYAHRLKKYYVFYLTANPYVNRHSFCILGSQTRVFFVRNIKPNFDMQPCIILGLAVRGLTALLLTFSAAVPSVSAQIDSLEKVVAAEKNDGDKAIGFVCATKFAIMAATTTRSALAKKV